MTSPSLGPLVAGPLDGADMPNLAALLEGMQVQIAQLRESEAGLRRDLEVMSRTVASLDKREANHYREHVDKIDKIARGLTDVSHESEQDPTSPEQELILATGQPMTGDLARAARVFCGGSLLEAVQCARIFSDSKTFVDMPMKDEPEVILEAFEQLQDKEDPESLRQFVVQWFAEAGSENEDWKPSDFTPKPARLNSITNPEMREWAFGINKLWPTLCRRQKPEVSQSPQRYSALPRSNPMVVPGGRFREMYYWDTFWVIRGLIICNMKNTAREIVEDMLDHVRKYGYYPNGGRIYYLDRSQPPMLTAMVRAVYNDTRDKEWLAEALPTLEKEYKFWMDPRGGRLVELPKVAEDGESHILNIYRSVRQHPRPESYFEDTEAYKEAEKLGRTPGEVYEALCSGAESGWDFSTRWLEDGTGRVPLGTANMSSINTCKVIPVDLNSKLYDIEKTLAKFHRDLNGEDSEAAKMYEGFAAARARTMNYWLWMGGTYRDYRLDTGNHSAVVSLSDFAAPLWAALYGPDNNHANAMITSLKRSGMLRLCGCATTAVDTMGRTQWDAPNAWPPIQLMLIEGLDKIPDGVGDELANCLSDTWLRTNHLAWQMSGFMHEKYDVFEPGRCGVGGEYEPQVGFGWSNGVALCLLVRPSRVLVKRESSVERKRDDEPRRHINRAGSLSSNLHGYADGEDARGRRMVSRNSSLQSGLHGLG